MSPLPEFRDHGLPGGPGVHRRGGAKLLPSFDMFNMFNANTVMGQRANQNAANANQVFGILAPRIARVGLMVNF